MVLVFVSVNNIPNQGSYMKYNINYKCSFKILIHTTINNTKITRLKYYIT